MSVSRTVY